MMKTVNIPLTTREELEHSFQAHYKDNDKLNEIADELIQKADKAIKERIANGETTFTVNYYYTKCKNMTYDERYNYIHHYIKKLVESLGMKMTNFQLSHEDFKFKVDTDFKIKFKEEEVEEVEEVIEEVEEAKEAIEPEVEVVPTVCCHVESEPSGVDIFFLVIVVAIIATAYFFNK